MWGPYGERGRTIFLISHPTLQVHSGVIRDDSAVVERGHGLPPPVASLNIRFESHQAKKNWINKKVHDLA